MEAYGQFCPVSLAAEIFARRWSPLIVRELLAGSSRFNDLRRGMPNITPSVLSRRLDELAIAGIVERRKEEDGTRYVLTPAGEELRPVVEQLGLWGRRWLPTEYRQEDLDPRLLVWDIHRNLQLEQVPMRTLIELHFSDAPAEYRAYWLIVTPEGAEVCLTHPGGDIDLHLATDVRTLTNIWMGNTTWASALRAQTLRLTGPTQLRRALPGWLKLNPFAAIAPHTRTA
ncbi:MAG TPA: helix-turn-helix domain-containing protein [Solirubrobacteraceae bacterium]|nr:helix-turn-helix domain-containing protein [Solirubrobacteraceae bacterium]